MKQILLLIVIVLSILPAGRSQGIYVLNNGVGIGTTTPQGGLSVAFNNSDLLNFYSPTNDTFAIQTLIDGRPLVNYGNLSGDEAKNLLVFQPVVGRVGIGTTTPAQKLDVAGTAKVGGLIVGESTIFTVGVFESEEQAIPASGTNIILSHNLGGVPRMTAIVLRCKTSEYGWSAGDEILLGSIHMLSNNHGYTAAVNATQFKYRQYGNFYIHRMDTVNYGMITLSNWRLVFRAWR